MELHCADLQLNTTSVYNNTIHPQFHLVLPRYAFSKGNIDTLWNILRQLKIDYTEHNSLYNQSKVI